MTFLVLVGTVGVLLVGAGLLLLRGAKQDQPLQMADISTKDALKELLAKAAKDYAAQAKRGRQ